MKNKNLAEKLWAEHSNYIRKFCSHKLSSAPQLIDDCVQDVFLSLVEALENGTEILNPKAYLTAIANNKVKDIYSSEAKRKSKLVPFSDEYIKDTDSAINYLEENIDDKSTEKFLSLIISSLTDEERLLIEDWCSNNLSQKQIAEKIDISENAVKQRLFRLKRKVINKIKELGI